MKIMMSLLLVSFVAQVVAQTPGCDSIVYPGDFNRDGVYNNQDANGDGIVDTLDLTAIYENYDSTHTCIIKNQIVTMVNGLHIDYNKSFNADNTVKIHQYYIDVKNYNFHGFAFTRGWNRMLW